jgi:hypothetical protein
MVTRIDVNLMIARENALMGRPALGVQPTQVRLPNKLREQIRALVGDRGMAAFIREAIEEKLARQSAAAKRQSKKPRPD